MNYYVDENEKKQKLKKLRIIQIIIIVVVIAGYLVYTKKKADVLYSEVSTSQMQTLAQEKGIEVNQLPYTSFLENENQSGVYIANSKYYPDTENLLMKATQPTTGEMTAAFLVTKDGKAICANEALNFYYGILFIEFDRLSQEDFDNIQYFDILRSPISSPSDYDPSVDVDKRIRFVVSQ